MGYLLPLYKGIVMIELFLFQHAMLMPILVAHLRFHKCLCVLENQISYRFKNRLLVQQALTHPSYFNYSTNPDHSRNSLSNCGSRQPEYGDKYFVATFYTKEKSECK